MDNLYKGYRELIMDEKNVVECRIRLNYVDYIDSTILYYNM